jgi:DNA-binding response OmpR family regulator
MNKILVVEDDAGILEVVKIVLEEEHYHVLTAMDVESALELLRSERPDLVLLDIWLAGESGTEVATYIKQDASLSAVPVILLSANREIEKIAKETGVDNFLPKPFDIEDLVAIVGKHIKVLQPAEEVSSAV